MASATVPKKFAGSDSNAMNVTIPSVMKTADSKGRIVLGGRFANRHVIIEWISATELVIKLARVIPESEAWLYENTLALNSVRKGLGQARAGELVEGPDVAADEAFAGELED